MIQLILVLEICAIYSELVISLELAMVPIGSSPRILAFTRHDEHAVIDGGTVVFAPHFDLGGWRVIIGIGSEDDPPSTANLVDFRSPQVS